MDGMIPAESDNRRSKEIDCAASSAAQSISFWENGTGARLPRAGQSMLWMRPWISLPTVSANQPMEGMRVRSLP